MVPAVARADARSEADGHARRGIALYNLGKYEDAIAEFEEAYQLFQSDALLFNLAQAHRKLEHCERALEYYHLFLAGHPAPALAAQVESLLPKLEEACRTRDERPDGPVPTTPQPTATAAPVAATADAEPATPGVEDASLLHVTAGAITGEVISAGVAPLTGVRVAATVQPPWLAGGELGLALGAANLWRSSPDDNAQLVQLGATIGYRARWSWGSLIASGELGAQLISQLDFSSGVVPGTLRTGQWAPLARGEVGAEHDVAPSWAVRAALAAAASPQVGYLMAPVAELDLEIGVRYER
ncbi:MAG TPA: tetratricopeptide repeat protein [Kofleriaceae bacterium]